MQRNLSLKKCYLLIFIIWLERGEIREMAAETQTGRDVLSAGSSSVVVNSRGWDRPKAKSMKLNMGLLNTALNTHLKHVSFKSWVQLTNGQNRFFFKQLSAEYDMQPLGGTLYLLKAALLPRREKKNVFVIKKWQSRENFNSLILDIAFRCFGILIAWIRWFPKLASALEV